MTSLKFVAPVLCALALSGCQSTSVDIPGAITTVQEATKKICAFVPTAQTVANILAALGIGAVVQFTDVAGQICNAVTKVSAKRGGSVPMVAGVVIRGYFVR